MSDTNDDDMLDDDLDWEAPGAQIEVVVVTDREDIAAVFHQTKVIAPQYNFAFEPPSKKFSKNISDFAIFVIEARIMSIFEDLQLLRDIRQERALVPILCLTENNDVTFQSGLYGAGSTEVLRPDIDPQILALKLNSYSKLSESGAILEIKNTESIQAMKSLREANENLKKEMTSRIDAESKKAIAEKQAEEAKKIREIMDHLTEGYFWVTPDRKIGDQTSKACSTIFGSDIANYEIASGSQLSFKDSNKEMHLVACLDQIFDNLMPASVSLSMIPRKCELTNDKIITLDYTIISDKSGAPEKIIIQAKDITAAEEERQKSDSILRENQQIINILRNKESFQNFISDFEDLIGEIKTVGASDLVIVNRNLHTLKGNSALFGLSEVAHTIHEIESQVVNADLNQIDPLIPEVCERIEEKIKDFLTKHNDILQVDYGNYIEKFSIDTLLLDKLYEIAQELPNDAKYNLIESLDLIKMRPVSYFTALFENTVKKMADIGSKKIHFQLSGLDLRVNVERLEPLFNNLIHALRNSCDHGIETPEDRQVLGKPEVGTVQMSFVRDGVAGIHIQIKDDGGGIDHEKIKARAVQKDLLSVEEAEKLSAADATELIFRDGLSTAKEISDISGRGVGMAALKNKVEELGGHIKTTTVISQGTTFDIIIPDRIDPTSDLQNKLEVGFKVMVCEDEEALAQIYTEVLSRKGFNVTAFDNGMDALLELSKQKYDLIITDLCMPGLGGTTVIQKIRELSPNGEITPVVVISGYISDEVREILSGHVQVNLLEKPVGIRKLIPVVEEVLGISGQGRGYTDPV